MPASRAEIAGYLDGIGRSIVGFQVAREQARKEKEKLEDEKQQQELRNRLITLQAGKLEREAKAADDEAKRRQDFIKNFSKTFGGGGQQDTQQAPPELAGPTLAASRLVDRGLEPQEALRAQEAIQAPQAAQLSQPGQVPQQQVNPQQTAAPQGQIDPQNLAPPPAFGTNPQYLALGVQAVGAGHTQLGQELIKRGLGATPMEQVKELRAQSQLALNQSQDRRENARLELQQQRFGVDRRIAEADLRSKALSGKEKQVTIEREKQALKKDILLQDGMINYASSLAGRAAASDNPEEQRRFQAAAQLVLNGKPAEATRLAFPDGENPTKASLAAQSEDPNATPQEREAAKKALAHLSSVTVNPDGSVTGNPQKVFEAQVKKAVLVPQYELLAGNLSAFDQINKVREIVQSEPAAAGFAGRASVLYRGFLENIELIADPKASRLKEAVRDQQSGLASATIGTDFYKKSLATVLAIRFNGGAGRLTDEDFKRGEQEVQNRFSFVTGPSNFMDALNTIEGDIRLSSERATKILSPYADVSGFQLPPSTIQAPPAPQAPVAPQPPQRDEDYSSMSPRELADRAIQLGRGR